MFTPDDVDDPVDDGGGVASSSSAVSVAVPNVGIVKGLYIMEGTEALRRAPVVVDGRSGDGPMRRRRSKVNAVVGLLERQ